MIRVFAILVLGMATLVALGQKPDSHSVEDIREKNIIDRLHLLPEIKEKNRYIDSLANHKHGISFITLKKPKSEKDYYWIQAGFNGDIRFETYYNFYVYYPKMKIEIFDPTSNKAYSLSEWRKKYRRHL